MVNIISDLVQRIQYGLGVGVVGVQALSSLAVNSGLFELFQPSPHQSGQDEGIPLHTQPLPGAAVVQL